MGQTDVTGPCRRQTEDSTTPFYKFHFHWHRKGNLNIGKMFIKSRTQIIDFPSETKCQ